MHCRFPACVQTPALHRHWRKPLYFSKLLSSSITWVIIPLHKYIMEIKLENACNIWFKFSIISLFLSLLLLLPIHLAENSRHRRLEAWSLMKLLHIPKWQVVPSHWNGFQVAPNTSGMWVPPTPPRDATWSLSCPDPDHSIAWTDSLFLYALDHDCFPLLTLFSYTAWTQNTVISLHPVTSEKNPPTSMTSRRPQNPFPKSDLSAPHPVCSLPLLPAWRGLLWSFFSISDLFCGKFYLHYVFFSD